MPYSDTFTHEKTVELIKQVHASKGYNSKRRLRILDCGVGSGLIGQAIKASMGEDFASICLIGLEVFPPYINDQELKTKINSDLSAYEEIITGDPQGNYAQYLPKVRKNGFDIIIFGDSLEHVWFEWAEHSLGHAIRVARELVIVNTPIVEYPQEQSFGNEYEAHYCFLSRELLESWGGKLEVSNSTVGCYSFDTLALKDKSTLKTKEL